MVMVQKRNKFVSMLNQNILRRLSNQSSENVSIKGTDLDVVKLDLLQEFHNLGQEHIFTETNY